MDATLSLHGIDSVVSAFPPAKYLVALCTQLWPSEETLPQITKVPILFLSGLKDEIVP